MLAFSIQLLIDTYQRRRLGAKYSNKNVAMMGIATPMKYCPMVSGVSLTPGRYNSMVIVGRFGSAYGH
ncbi:hypothetical protein [Ochrobactrum sp. MYb379]|uniref:hypothetical protein n=1 Tax=Ochrobactrum sp. MYb379 TaxID=2745275 RepID=UPI0030B5134C